MKNGFLAGVCLSVIFFPLGVMFGDATATKSSERNDEATITQADLKQALDIAREFGADRERLNALEDAQGRQKSLEKWAEGRGWIAPLPGLEVLK